MLKYTMRRILLLIPVLLGATFLLFCMLSLAPGDPVNIILGADATPEAAAVLRAELGLDQPLLTRYLDFLVNMCHGDFGLSYSNRQPVADEIWARFPNTILLATLTTLFASVIGIPLGIISAVKQYSVWDNISISISLLGASMPTFWLALMLMLVFSLNLGWLPPSGSYGPEYWILPVVTVSLTSASSVTRMTRSSMLDVVRQDYIRTARAKGQTEQKIILNHELPNALIPIITVVGMQFASNLGGAIMCESVFAIPGIGTLMITAINARNHPMVLACSVLTAVVFSLVAIFVDLLYAFVDPRIRSQYASGKRRTVRKEVA